MIGLIGYNMLQGERASFHTPTKDDAKASVSSAIDMAITPLAIPVLAGPGTIATAMNFAAQADMEQMGNILAAMATMCVVTFAAFVGGDRMTRYLGPNAVKVISRLMRLLLAVVGTQMFIDGVHGATGR